MAYSGSYDPRVEAERFAAGASAPSPPVHPQRYPPPADPVGVPSRAAEPEARRPAPKSEIGADRPSQQEQDARLAQRRRYRRGRARQVLLGGFDAIAVGGPLALTSSLWPADVARNVPVVAWIAVVVLWLVTLHLYGLYPRYPRHITTSTLNELPQLFHAGLVGLVLTWTLLTALGASGLGVPLAVFGVGAMIVLPLLRITSRSLLTLLVGPERLLLVGTGTTTPRASRWLRSRGDLFVVAAVALPDQWRRELDASDRERRDLDDLVVDERIDRVLLSTRELGDSAVKDFLHWSRRANVSLTVLPEHFDVVGVGAAFDQIQGGTVISLQPPILSRTARILKRTLDLVGAIAGLVALAPALVVIAVAVKVDSPGPAFFRQERIGRRGRTFRLIKFRSMVPDADRLVEELMAQSSDPDWLQLERDPRITRVGRFLRSTSLDELPQLWNVLVGHMSLVGPRPLSVRDDARVGGWARGRLDITPGLTGLWQVVGRKSLSFEEMVQLDFLYVSNWSLWGDVKLLCQTIPAVIGREGAR